MLTFPEHLAILVSLKPIDMRCGIDSLTVMIAEQLQHSPQEKSVFIFCNRQRNKIKSLYWDKNGFVLVYKRLGRKKFYIPKTVKEGPLEITHQQLSWPLAGFDFMNLVDYAELTFTNYS